MRNRRRAKQRAGGATSQLSLLGWLLPGTAGVLRSGWPTQKACRLLHGRRAAPCPNQRVYREDGGLVGTLLQGGTSTAAQSTGHGSPRKDSLGWILPLSGWPAPGLSSTGRQGRRRLGRTRHCRERCREGPLHVCQSALGPARRRHLPNAAGGRRGGQAMLRLARVQTATLQ